MPNFCTLAEHNSSDINTTDFLFADTDLQALFDNDFELQNGKNALKGGKCEDN
jgi:hypothetical protein